MVLMSIDPLTYSSSAQSMARCRGWLRGFGLGSSPALLAFAADAGAFAELVGQDVRMAGVGVAPGQVGLQPAGTAPRPPRLQRSQPLLVEQMDHITHSVL